MPSRRLRMKQSGRFRPSWTSPAEAEQLHMVCSSEGYLCPPRSGGEREGRGATSRAAFVSPPPPCSFHSPQPKLRFGVSERTAANRAVYTYAYASPPRAMLVGGGIFIAAVKCDHPPDTSAFAETAADKARGGGGISIAPAGSPMQSFDSPRGGQRKTENAPATVCPLWGPAIGPSLFCASLYHSAALVREGVFP